MSRLLTSGAIALALVVGTARADSGEVPHPPGPRLFHAPTAWLQPHAGGHGAIGANHRADYFLALTGGLGDVAEIGLDFTDDFVDCQACDEGRAPQPVHAVAATFKVGVRAGLLGSWQPALALGFRRTVPALDAGQVELARMYLAASLATGPVRLHAGADLWDGRGGDRAPIIPALHRARLREQLRGFAGVEYRPAPYPRTAMIGELSFVPEPEGDRLALRRLAAGGIRYQALSWGGVELGVRVREGDDLGDVTVFVRLTGVLRVVD